MDTCRICGHAGEAVETAKVRSNIRRFKTEAFNVWRCARCHSLHCEEVADIAPYYEDYPLRRQEPGYFMNQWFGNIHQRLVKAGLRREHRLLDYGCSKGILIDLLRDRGYPNIFGYDPYVEKYSDPAVLEGRYDFVVNLDVIEHVEDPLTLLQTFSRLVKPGGVLCLETPNADGIDLSRPEDYIHTLHMPNHLHILSEAAVGELADKAGFARGEVYRRWYMDTPAPATSRRFIELFMKAHGNDMESAFDPPRPGVFLTTPALWFHALFGYWFPPAKNDHVMMMLRRRQ